jgi:hypothetical protein
MEELDEKQWDELRQLHELASLADMEADAALYSGDLEDTRSAVASVVTASEALTLSSGLARDLQGMALEALKAADGEDKPQNCAAGVMGAVDRIEQLIESRFASSGRKL